MHTPAPRTKAVSKREFPLGLALIALLLIVLIGYGISVSAKGGSSERRSSESTQPQTQESIPELSLTDIINKRQQEAAEQQAAAGPNPEFTAIFDRLGYTEIDENFGGLPTISFVEMREGDDTTIYETEIAYDGEYVVEIAHLTYRKNHFDTMGEMMTWLEKNFSPDSYRFSQDYYVIIHHFYNLDTEDGMRAYLQLDPHEEISPMVWYYLRDAYLESGYIMK